jgi:hypothetical protein
MPVKENLDAKMNVTPDEAQASLAEVENIVARTRLALASTRCGPMLVVWGIIWMIGYSGTQFFPAKAGLLWAVLDCAGFAATIALVRSSPSRGDSALGRKIGLAWLALCVYSVVWAFILRPFNWQFFGAYPAAVAMFGYVVMGIWFGGFLLSLGLTVTALALAGILFLPDWLNLWMGVTAGGSLVAAGVHIQTRWK